MSDPEETAEDKIINKWDRIAEIVQDLETELKEEKAKYNDISASEEDAMTGEADNASAEIKIFDKWTEIVAMVHHLENKLTQARRKNEYAAVLFKVFGKGLASDHKPTTTTPEVANGSEITSQAHANTKPTSHSSPEDPKRILELEARRYKPSIPEQPTTSKGTGKKRHSKTFTLYIQRKNITLDGELRNVGSKEALTRSQAMPKEVGPSAERVTACAIVRVLEDMCGVRVVENAVNTVSPCDALRKTGEWVHLRKGGECLVVLWIEEEKWEGAE